MSNVRDYTHGSANSRAEDCIGCGRHQEHPVADASGEGPYCKTCAEHSNGGFGDPALTLPARQTDGPPRIWGEEMGMSSHDVTPRFLCFYASITCRYRPESGNAEVGDRAVGYGVTPAEAALAIEAELTRIETEIRTAREGKK